ncbi:MAG: response regulator receiver and sensor-containing signal transduction diguanylate [Moraxellaceae bacterium]|jgi:diguanylate cyclase (GGDEF)-like protein/PAS domain S-box-containing protein|nr:response regulator receiver and sensor-containing signal transduction diguanylate [Moraxellaceae bacterium]
MIPHPAILVVDDQSSNLIAMEAVFEGEPVDLVKANSGAEALKLMLQRDFALVLLDVQMPELDGFEVAEIMRSNPRTESTPIIFLTALSKEQRYIFRGYETGAVDYLFKPIDASILRSKVRVFLELDRKNRSLRESLRLLQQERDHNQTLLRSLSEGLLGITQSGNVFYANPTAEEMLDSPLRDLIGRRLTEIFQLYNENAEPVEWPLPELLSSCERGERVHRDDLFMNRDGQQIAVEISANPLMSGDPARAGVAGVVVVFRDVSSRRQNEKVLTRKATLDSLTGLCNRAEFERLLEERVAQANRSETSLALLYIDLDRFKAINDTLGHHVGDQVLKAAAKRLHDSSRATDLVARLGGDEFVIVLESTEPRRAASLVSGKVLQAFARVVDVADGSKLQIGTSVGIAIYPDDSTHSEDLLKCADKAMYQAKTAGRNTYRFYRG